jgi:hypothetical protein
MCVQDSPEFHKSMAECFARLDCILTFHSGQPHRLNSPIKISVGTLALEVSS